MTESRIDLLSSPEHYFFQFIYNVLQGVMHKRRPQKPYECLINLCLEIVFPVHFGQN